MKSLNDATIDPFIAYFYRKTYRIALEEHFASNSFIFLNLIITAKMGGRSHMTETQRAQIVVLHQKGDLERQIGARIGCSKNVVHNSLKIFEKDRSYCDKPKLGRLRKISKRRDIMIKKAVVRSPSSTTNKIRSELLRKGTIISKKITRRCLSQEFGLKSCKPARKPRLTERMKSKRLAFAHKCAGWSPEQWANGFFLVESTEQQFATTQRHVWRAERKRYEHRYLAATVKHPPSLMLCVGLCQQKEQLDCVSYLIA